MSDDDVSLPALLSHAIRPHLDLSRLQAILGRYWLAVADGILSTRAYDKGVELAFNLLEGVERYHDQFGEKTVRDHRITLYWFLLTMLDRSDQWETYLDACESIRANSGLCLTYGPSSLDVHGPQMGPFILRRDAGCIRVHFLYSTLHRKEQGR